MSEPDVEPTHQPLLRIEGLTKRFANVHALTDVGFALRGGEVLALVGENGAGKSTLLKILSGDYKADAGVVAIDGRPVVFTSPREARAAGIRVISQEPEIVPGVSVAENLFLGDLPRRGFGFVHGRDLLTRAQETSSASASPSIDPSAPRKPLACPAATGRNRARPSG